MDTYTERCVAEREAIGRARWEITKAISALHEAERQLDTVTALASTAIVTTHLAEVARDLDRLMVREAALNP